MAATRTIAVGALALAMAGNAELHAEDRTVNVAVERRSGDKTRGPATITLTRVNVLRYDVAVGVSVTYAGGPDLTIPFIPPVGVPPAPRVAEEQKVAGAGSDPLAPIMAALMALENARVSDVQAVIAGLVDLSNRTKQTVDALVQSSDGALRMEHGPQQLIDSADSASTAIEDTLKLRWPTSAIMTQLAMLAGIRADLARVPVSTLSADQKRTFDYIEARLPALDQWYASVGVQSEAAQAALAARGKLEGWKLLLDALVASGADAFTLDPVVVDCGFSFGGSKESKVELVKRDRLAAPGTAEVREEIITVVCSSPLSVSGGFGFSSVDLNAVGLIQSTRTTQTDGEETTTVISRFGYTERSGYRAFPLLFLNTRVHEWNDTYSLHLSAGAGVDADGEPGSDVEYILGGTLGIKRDVLVTVGWHFAHDRTLAGGFAIDGEVPEGISAAPVEKQRNGGLMIAVSFKLR